MVSEEADGGFDRLEGDLGHFLRRVFEVGIDPVLDDGQDAVGGEEGRDVQDFLADGLPFRQVEDRQQFVDVVTDLLRHVRFFRGHEQETGGRLVLVKIGEDLIVHVEIAVFAGHVRMCFHDDRVDLFRERVADLIDEFVCAVVVEIEGASGDVSAFGDIGDADLVDVLLFVQQFEKCRYNGLLGFSDASIHNVYPLMA